MTTVDRVRAICKDRKIPISKLEKDLGFANGYLGQLRKGVLPDDRLNKISSYLGLSPLTLSGSKDDLDLQLVNYIKQNVTYEEFSTHIKYICKLYICHNPSDNYFRKEIFNDYLSMLRLSDRRKKK